MQCNANLRCIISIREVALANYAESFHECDFFLQKMLMEFSCTSTGNEILTLTDLDENFIFFTDISAAQRLNGF